MASGSAALLIGVACVIGVASLALVVYLVLLVSKSARKAGVPWTTYLRETRGRTASEGEEAAPPTSAGTGLARMLGRIDLPLVTLLLIALALRVSWVLVIQPPSWDIYRDSMTYDRMARWILSSGTLSMSDGASAVPTAFAAPGYPLLVAVMYAVFGTGGSRATAVYLAQTVVSVAVLFVMYRIGLRMYGRKVGLLAVGLGAVYWPFVMANNLLLTEVLFMLLLCLLVLAAVRLLDSASWWNAVLLGALLAACCLVRPVVVAWGVVPFLFLIRKVPFRRIAALAGVAVVAFALLMTPWWVRNAVVFDRFVPFTTSSANPLLVGTHYAFPGDEGISGDVFDIVSDSPQEELEKNARWQKEAIERLEDQLRNHPGALFKQRLDLTRVALTWPYDLIIWKVPRWVHNAAVAGQITLMVLALAGFIMGWRSRRSWMLFTLVVYFVVVHVVVLIFNRYVFPVMPVVILAAAYAIVTAVTGLRRSRLWRRRAVAAE